MFTHLKVCMCMCVCLFTCMWDHVQGWAHYRASAAVPGPEEGPCLFVRRSRFDTLAYRAVRCADLPDTTLCIIALTLGMGVQDVIMPTLQVPGCAVRQLPGGILGLGEGAGGRGSAGPAQRPAVPASAAGRVHASLP